MRYLTFFARRRKRGQALKILFVGLVCVFAMASVLQLVFSRKAVRRRSHIPVPECVGATSDVYSVGSCQKFMTHITDCKDIDSTWKEDIFLAVNEEASSLGRKKLRELRLENGKTLHAVGPIPSAVYALFDREQFVFPTCHVGTQFSIDLPSANIRVNATGDTAALSARLPND